MKTERIVALTRLGIAPDDIDALRRIAGTLSRWAEQECGDSNDHASWAIERDEDTNIPYRATYYHDGRTVRTRIADRETGALKRLAAIMERYPDLVAYHQTDPRGASVYLVPKERLAGRDITTRYTDGTAVY
jgi:hypothetical protein